MRVVDLLDPGFSTSVTPKKAVNLQGLFGSKFRYPKYEELLGLFKQNTQNYKKKNKNPANLIWLIVFVSIWLARKF